MSPLLQVVGLFLVAAAMALVLAHALEFPGKRRLSKEQYLVVQPIYYPGFTIGGIAEPLAMLTLIALLFVTPGDETAFWLTAGSLVALIAMHAAYWLLTHPVNNFWLQGYELKSVGRGFFGFDPLGRRQDRKTADWTDLRDRWEYSHVLRAGLGVLSFILLASAVAA